MSKYDESDVEYLYGFPVVPNIEGEYITFEFPEGYDPDGEDDLREVADNLLDLCGVEDSKNKVTKKKVKVKLSPEKLSWIILNAYLELEG